MPFEQDEELLFETHRPVVLDLVCYVLANCPHVRLAHRKSSVTALPFKGGVVRPHPFHPDARDALQLLHPPCLRHLAAQAGQHVNVILNTARYQGITSQFPGDTPQIGVKRSPDLKVPEERTPILCGKDHMNINSRQRL